MCFWVCMLVEVQMSVCEGCGRVCMPVGRNVGECVCAGAYVGVAVGGSVMSVCEGVFGSGRARVCITEMKCGSGYTWMHNREQR